MTGAQVIDSFQFFGPNPVPATVSFHITWTASGPPTHYKPGSSDPTDPRYFAGTFRQQAAATGSFSGTEAGFSFTVDPGTTFSDFAEMGIEQNGSFLH